MAIKGMERFEEIDTIAIISQERVVGTAFNLGADKKRVFSVVAIDFPSVLDIVMQVNSSPL